jgi:hypothetical protein
VNPSPVEEIEILAEFNIAPRLATSNRSDAQLEEGLDLIGDASTVCV